MTQQKELTLGAREAIWWERYTLLSTSTLQGITGAVFNRMMHGKRAFALPSPGWLVGNWAEERGIRLLNKWTLKGLCHLGVFPVLLLNFSGIFLANNHCGW